MLQILSCERAWAADATPKLKRQSLQSDSAMKVFNWQETAIWDLLCEIVQHL